MYFKPWVCLSLSGCPLSNGRIVNLRKFFAFWEHGRALLDHIEDFGLLFVDLLHIFRSVSILALGDERFFLWYIILTTSM